ncbi:E3 ubiquitin- ligase DZIP3 [Paramuricea clavata]|uniref:E3 ubiquitin- ligase DZIP3 n=1 Tax=Paramuricea clavata TaxID=317549 RepID=A0A6S7JDC4_PARCT|nr:E3 ubiquitin- ligase DZIP3 [Paramuricea clavata]
MEKLPKQFRLTITRGQNFLEWSMEEMLNAFKKELELRKAHNAVGTNSDREQERHEQERHERNSGNIKKYGQHHHGTAAALLANERRGNCVFCLKNHNHEDCEGVKDPRARKSLARKYGRCFLCLFKGHRASNCTVKNRCNVCNGAHHVALYDASPKEDDKRDKTVKPDEESKQVPVNTNVHVTSSSSNLHAGTGSLVALRTARGVLRGERGLRRELLGINTFGQKCTNAEHREVVELKLEPVNGNKVISLEAFVVPEICRIQNSHVELARREYPHLKGIRFSDVSKCQGELQIDVLIGADYLWNFQTGVTKRGKSGEPVAIETELGWVLSGPLRVQDIEGAELAQVNFVAQTMNNEDSLESNVQKLWSFEGLGICEEDKVHEVFLDGISLQVVDMQ